MSLNMYMHPRNPFKIRKPDFKALATKYTEFRQHAIMDLKGSVHLDFKKPECLRALSWALMKDEFQLDVEMPLDRLIPTIPLRLNYILWIEDLLSQLQEDCSNVHGIDIGTGASCVYPLIGAAKNGWNFLATECDDTNVNYAQNNVERNKMSSLIQIAKCSPRDILLEALTKNIVNKDQNFLFCMCNPPFFGNTLEAWGITNTRKESRSEPNSINTSSTSECIFPGGEVEFVRLMISDSHQLKKRVKIFTTMLGKKSSVIILKEDMKRSGVPIYNSTEFCQGRTMRWGLAWSFDQSVKICKNVLGNKQKKPLQLAVPKGTALFQDKYTSAEILKTVKNILCELEMKFTEVTNQRRKQQCDDCLLVTATSNTWSHQRRKRRRLFQDKDNCNVKSKELKIVDKQSCVVENSLDSESTNKGIIRSQESKDTSNTTEVCEEQCSVDKEFSPIHISTEHKNPSTDIYYCVQNETNRMVSKDQGNIEAIDGATPEILNQGTCNKVEERVPILTFEMCVFKNKDTVMCSMEYKNGQNYEFLHQVLQYFKNRFNSMIKKC